MLTIDGSTLEGGGQLTRLSLCLAAITRQPIRIHSIRAGRSVGRGLKGRSANGGQAREQRRDANSKGRDRGGPGKGAGRNTKSNSKSNSKSLAGDRAPAPAAGLKDSHLAALTFLAEMAGATVEGDELGSAEVVFRPSPRSSATPMDANTEHTVALTKPGSVWLIFQAVYPYLCFCTDWSRFTVDDDQSSHESPGGSMRDCISLRLHGGTIVPKAMTTEYMTQVFAPLAERIGLPRLEIETVKAGWAGNAPEIGEVIVRIFPPISSQPHPPSSSLSNNTTLPNQKQTPTLHFQPFTLPRHRGLKSITSITTTIIADPTTTTTTLQTKLCTILSNIFPTVPIETKSTPSGDPRRLYVLLVAHSATGILGVDYLGGGGRPKTVTEAERLLDDACRIVVADLVREVNGRAAVDRHMADQLVVFQALAAGRSCVASRVDGSGDEDGDGDGNEHGDGAVDIEKEVEAGGRPKKSNPHDDQDQTNPAGYTGATRKGIDAEPDEDRGEDEVTDTSGSLHARTVRWVCSQILGRGGDGNRQGRPPENEDEYTNTTTTTTTNTATARYENENGNGNEIGNRRGDEDHGRRGGGLHGGDRSRRGSRRDESSHGGIRFEQGGVCHGIGWDSFHA